MKIPSRLCTSHTEINDSLSCRHSNSPYYFRFGCITSAMNSKSLENVSSHRHFIILRFGIYFRVSNKMILCLLLRLRCMIYCLYLRYDLNLELTCHRIYSSITYNSYKSFFLFFE